MNVDYTPTRDLMNKVSVFAGIFAALALILLAALIYSIIKRRKLVELIGSAVLSVASIVMSIICINNAVRIPIETSKYIDKAPEAFASQQKLYEVTLPKVELVFLIVLSVLIVLFIAFITYRYIRDNKKKEK